MDLLRPAVRAAVRTAPRLQLSSLAARPPRSPLRARLARAAVLAQPGADALHAAAALANARDAADQATAGAHDALALSRLRNRNVAADADVVDAPARAFYDAPLYRTLLLCLPTYEDGGPLPASSLGTSHGTTWVDRFRAMRHDAIREHYAERHWRWPSAEEVEAQDERNFGTAKAVATLVWFTITYV
jgi:hypothetical protein